jgi:hypothetical protein
MGFDQARYEPRGGGNDQEDFSWSSVAKTIQGIAQDPTVAALGKTALQMAPSVLGGAASGAMAGGPMGALLGGGGAILSGLLGGQPAAGQPAAGQPAAAPQTPAAQFPQLPPQLAQLAPLAAQVMPALPAPAQATVAPILQLLQNPQFAALLGYPQLGALLGAFGGGAVAGPRGATFGRAGGESDAEEDQEGVYDFLVGNGFAAER